MDSLYLHLLQALEFLQIPQRNPFSVCETGRLNACLALYLDHFIGFLHPHVFGTRNFSPKHFREKLQYLPNYYRLPVNLLSEDNIVIV